VVVVRGDLPLGCVLGAAVTGLVVVVGAVVTAVARGAGVVLLVMGTRRPSGLVPYCTGWNNLKLQTSNSQHQPIWAIPVVHCHLPIIHVIKTKVIITTIQR